MQYTLSTAKQKLGLEAKGERLVLEKYGTEAVHEVLLEVIGEVLLFLVDEEGYLSGTNEEP